jgi:prepilin-type N-terminal cleavage/methylation domain-containing protein
MNRRLSTACEGFTLIEIIIVVGVLALFVAVIYSSFFGTIRAIRATDDLKDSFQSARVIAQRIQSDLKGASHVLNDPRYVFKGTDAYGDDPDLDRLDFVTSSRILTDDGVPQSNLAELSYFIYSDGPYKHYLVRREDIYPDDEPHTGGEFKIIADNVVGLNFRYFYIETDTDEDVLTVEEQEEEEKTWWDHIADPDNWHDEWDWEEWPFMPIMVRIELTTKEGEGPETTFSTIVYLNRDPGTVAQYRQSQAAEDEGDGGEDEEETRGDSKGITKPTGGSMPDKGRGIRR